MKLPNGDKAVIDSNKLIRYSLNPDHEDGQHKARVFKSVVGITLDSVDLLLNAIRQASVNAETAIGKLDEYGQRYTTDFDFTGPSGHAVVRASWIVRIGEDRPQLVTCYIL